MVHCGGGADVGWHRRGVAVADSSLAALDMDVFNNPNLALPAVGSEVTVSFVPEAVKVL